ncbi:hypothetical protein WJX72_010263 [[Myrmecia] bisecta]|uniref:Uncharacterized protein n=1 Tax=[Myrmecia] bisecta TaxID=41462 RepID=A0AAW1PV29_9CHLO
MCYCTSRLQPAQQARPKVLQRLLSCLHTTTANYFASGGQHVAETAAILAGAIRNISNDTAIQQALTALGALDDLASLLRGLETQSADSSHRAQIAVQVTAIVRNLVSSAASQDGAACVAVLDALVQCGLALMPYPDVLLNIARTLSKLSSHQACQDAMSRTQGIMPLLVASFLRHADNKPTMLRMAYTAGNLTTSGQYNRAAFAAVPGGIDSVVALMRKYTAQFAKGSSQAQEVLIKVIRLVANLAIHPDLGPHLASEEAVAEGLMGSLAIGDCESEDDEELVLNAVSAVTNLAFYGSPSNKVTHLPAADLVHCIAPLLLSDNEEAVSEAARALSNLCREPQVPPHLVESCGVEALCLLLDHGNGDVVEAASGALVSVTAHSSGRLAVLSAGGFSQLAEELMGTQHRSG